MLQGDVEKVMKDVKRKWDSEGLKNSLLSYLEKDAGIQVSTRSVSQSVHHVKTTAYYHAVTSADMEGYPFVIDRPACLNAEAPGIA